MHRQVYTGMLAAWLALGGAYAGETDPTSYAIGTQFAENIISVVGADQLVVEDFLQGVRHVFGDAPFRLSSSSMSTLLTEYSGQRRTAKAPVPVDADVSYALGVNLSRDMMVHRAVLSIEDFLRGTEDLLQGRDPALSPQEIKQHIATFTEQWLERYQQLGQRNRQQGNAYLQKHRARDGVQELDSGVQYEILRAGDGARPLPASRVRVHYRGTSLDGAEFDSSYRTGAAASFSLQNVIRGWQQILPQMQTGAKWRIVVPPELAYGERGSPPAIGPHQTLIFDIELLEVL